MARRTRERRPGEPEPPDRERKPERDQRGWASNSVKNPYPCLWKVLEASIHRTNQNCSKLWYELSPCSLHVKGKTPTEKLAFFLVKEIRAQSNKGHQRVRGSLLQEGEAENSKFCINTAQASGWLLNHRCTRQTEDTLKWDLSHHHRHDSFQFEVNHLKCLLTEEKVNILHNKITKTETPQHNIHNDKNIT